MLDYTDRISFMSQAYGLIHVAALRNLCPKRSPTFKSSNFVLEFIFAFWNKIFEGNFWQGIDRNDPLYIYTHGL